MNYFKAVFAILKKDILMELRTKETVNATLVFGVLITLVFSFISEPSQWLSAIAGTLPGNIRKHCKPACLPCQTNKHGEYSGLQKEKRLPAWDPDTAGT